MMQAEDIGGGAPRHGLLPHLFLLLLLPLPLLLLLQLAMRKLTRVQQLTLSLCARVLLRWRKLLS